MAYTQAICDKILFIYFFGGGGGGFQNFAKKNSYKKKTLVRVLPRHELGQFFFQQDMNHQGQTV
jgi:hypothetical protein